MKRYILVFSISALLVFKSFLHADTYKYVDKNGVITFTSHINDIPKEYRDKIEIIKEENDIKKDVEPVKRSPSSISNTQKKDTQYYQNPEHEKTLWLKYENSFLPEFLLLLLSSLFFIFANRILFFIENKRIITFIRVSVVLLFLIFVFSKYVNNLLETSLDAKEDIMRIKKSIETKDVKIDQLTQ